MHIEVLARFVRAKVVLCCPKTFVDRLQPFAQFGQLWRLWSKRVFGAAKCCELGNDDVLSLRRCQTRMFDLENRDSIEQFTPGNGHGRIGHQSTASWNWSSCSVR